MHEVAGATGVDTGGGVNCGCRWFVIEIRKSTNL